MALAPALDLTTLFEVIFSIKVHSYSPHHTGTDCMTYGNEKLSDPQTAKPHLKSMQHNHCGSLGECLPGARPARYFSINYPDFSPRFTLPWRSPPSRPHCTAHLPYKARCKIKQDL